MKISKKEKNLLLILGAVGVGFAYYYFLYTPMSKSLVDKRREKTTIESDYNAKETRIKALSSYTQKNIDIIDDLCIKTGPYYPTIIQAKIITEIDKLLVDSGLKGDLAFSPVVATTIEKITAPKLEGTEGDLAVIVDGINSKIATEGYTAPAAGASSVTCEQLKLSISFTGSYDSLKKYIMSLEKYDRKIAINTLIANTTDGTLLVGTIELEFYGIPQLDGEFDEYLKWTIENVYGKEKIFGQASANGAYSSTIEQQVASKNDHDFAMMLRTSNSELPSLTLGKAKDEVRKTYLYSDTASVEDITIEFKEEGGVFYYKYKTAADFYPKDKSELGEKFTPVAGNIIIEITSEARSGSNDSSGVNLKVINNTSKAVEVIIKNDDQTKPRVNIKSEGNSGTSVSKK